MFEVLADNRSPRQSQKMYTIQKQCLNFKSLCIRINLYLSSIFPRTLKLLYFTQVKGRVTEKEGRGRKRERERETPFILWFTPPTPTTARTGQVLKSGLPRWSQGYNCLSPNPLPCRMHFSRKQESAMESELKPRHSNWCLTCYAKCLLPRTL